MKEDRANLIGRFRRHRWPIMVEGEGGIRFSLGLVDGGIPLLQGAVRRTPFLWKVMKKIMHRG